MTEPLLSARGVTRRYGRRVALAEADLELFRGDVIALVGPNGAGKSTLLGVLAGALVPSSGSVETVDPPPRIGWVPQRPALYGRLSARENLELFARLDGIADPGAAATGLLRRVELAAADVPAAELSVGNQQRLNVAIALLGGPDVLLLDEPTAALDPAHRRRVWDVASTVSGQGGAVVFASQHLDEVHALATRVVTLHDGRVSFAGTRAEFERVAEADVFA